MGTNTYPLEVPDEVWDDYKKTVPQSMNLDEPILEMIDERIEEHGVRDGGEE